MPPPLDPLRRLDRRAALSALFAFVLLNGLMLGTVGQFGPTLDDTYIHLQFARSLAEGDGLSYRDARPVSGSTGPLWTALLSVGASLDSLPLIGAGIAAHWIWLLSGTLLVLAAVELARCIRAFGIRPGLAALGLLWFLLCDLILWSTVSGMEILLFLWLSTWAMRLHQQQLHWRSWGTPATVFALGCLARPEGALLLLLAIADRLAATLPSERSTPKALLSLARDVAVPGLLLGGPFLLFGLWAQGGALPTAFAVKTDALHRGYPALRDLWLTAGVFFRSLPFATALAVGGVLELLRRRIRSRTPDRDRQVSLLPALWLIALPCAYSSWSAPGSQVALGNFGRYVYPLVPALLLLALLALEDFWEELPRSHGRASIWLRLVLAAVLIAPGLGGTRAGLARTTRNIWDVESGDATMARWLQNHLPKGTVLGVQDVGAVGYLTDLPLFDLAGLVDPEATPILKSPRPAKERLQQLLQLAEARHVAVLVLFPESYGGMPSLRLAAPGNWQELHSIDIVGNVTLAGSRLTALVPPWSQFSKRDLVNAPTAEGSQK